MAEKTTMHKIFLTGIFLKGIDGLLELLGGITLLFVQSTPAVDLVQTVFQHELAQDPTDFIANYLIHLSQNISASAVSFTAIYLIIHGAIKLGLFFGLWRKILWMYPLGGVILLFFVLYQFIRIFHTHSIILLLLTLIDVLIIVLLKFEYIRLLRQRAGSKTIDKDQV